MLEEKIIKTRNKFDKKAAVQLRLEGKSIKDIAEEINCAEITCYIGLKDIKVNRYFKETKGCKVVYKLLNIQKECIYVGQTTDFLKRWASHRVNSKFFDEVLYVVCYVVETNPDMAFIEAQLIAIDLPKYNKRLVDSSPSKHKIPYLKMLVYNLNGTLVDNFYHKDNDVDLI